MAWFPPVAQDDNVSKPQRIIVLYTQAVTVTPSRWLKNGVAGCRLCRDSMFKVTLVTKTTELDMLLR